MTDFVTDEDPIMPWCRMGNEFHTKFVTIVTAGEIPDLTIEEFNEELRKAGPFK